MTHYAFGGDIISADIPLGLQVVEDGIADVRVYVRHNDNLAEPVWQRLHVNSVLGNSRWMFGRTTSGNWAAVFGEGCRAEISSDLRLIKIEVLPAAPKGWIADIITGWALVYRMAVRNQPAFHGSAVVDRAGAVTIMGPSMSGKSTYATAALQRGYRLLADDTVVMLLSGGRTEVHSTATSVKLREQAQALRFPGQGSRETTFDHRTSVVMMETAELAPLRLMVFLDDVSPAGLHPLAPADAVAALLSNTKVGTWDGVELHEKTFEFACHLASATPAFRLGVDRSVPLKSAIQRLGSTLF